jgi:hypothetical protein
MAGKTYAKNMINAKIAGLLIAAFVAGTFVGSPELRAYAANTVFSTDIVDGQVKTADLAGNSVTAPKIKDGEVKAAEIATDAVGAAEIQDVTKLLFAQCTVSASEALEMVSLGHAPIICNINGVDGDDSVIANLNSGNACFGVTKSDPSSSGFVFVVVKNLCSSTQQLEEGTAIGLIVYDK